MPTYYSLLQAQLNVATGDRLAVGLVLADEASSVAFVAHSAHKLRIVRDLNGHDAARNLRWTLENIAKSAKELSTKRLLKDDLFRTSPFRESYLSYLSDYQSNLLLVSSPRRIELEANSTTFNFLYKRLVDEQGVDTVAQKHHGEFEFIKTQEWAKKHFRRDTRIDASLYAGIRFPVKVDLAGMNGQLTTVKYIGTDRPLRYINQDALAFKGLLDQAGNARHFLVSSEPNRVQTPEKHYAWKNIYQAFGDQYLPLSEIDTIRDYARVNGVEPVSISSEEE